MMEPLSSADTLGLIGLAARATLVLGAAFLLDRVLRKAAAGTRHVLWTTTFVLLLGLPLAAAWLPGWTLPVLPAVEPEARSAAVAVAGTPPDARTTTAGSVRKPPTVVETGSGAPGLSTGATGPSTGGTDPSNGAAGQPVTGSVESRDTGSGGPTPLSIALVLWALGSAGAVLSVTVGTLRFRALVRGSRPVENPVWLMHVGRLRARLGIDADVRVRTSADVSTPMTGGWRRPVILLPASARSWTPERRDVVLRHELIHVSRHDALRQAVARAALALYWFNPLAWIAVRVATTCREEACDEAVLAMGTRPSEYAGHLLALAESMAVRPARAALPMIQPSQLERRIMSILAPARPRTSALATAGLIAALGGVGLSAAVAQPVRAPETPSASADASPEMRDVAATRPEMLPERADAAPSEEILETRPEWSPPPAGALDRVQEPSCGPDDWRGSFTGTISTRGGDRQERSGWMNGDRVIQRFIDDLRLCMRIHGDVVMTDARDAVRAVGQGGWLVLESEEDDLRRLVITEGDAGIEHAWSVDGRSLPFDDEARAWRDHMFRILDAYWQASALRGQESSLRGRISSHRGHISSLRGQMSAARGHVSSLRGQISSSRGRVSSLEGRISSIRGRVSSMNGRISSLGARISSLRSARRSAEDEATRTALDREIASIEDRIAQTRAEIEAYDADARVREVERERAEYDVDDRVAAIEAEIAGYDLDGRLRELEGEIESYDLDGKIQALEREIEELDADRRAEALERGVESDVAALRRLIDG